MSAHYRFNGVNSSDAIVYNEQTVFIGFTWLVTLIAGAWLMAHWKRRDLTWGRVHLASLPVWALCFAASTRYIEGFAVYLSYATIIAAPAFVYAFAPIRHPRLDLLRWGLLAIVGAANCYLAFGVVLTSAAKNLPMLMLASSWPVSRGFTVDQTVQDEIGLAKEGVVSHSIAWGQPHWIFMAYHPEIPQFKSRANDPIPVPPGDRADTTSIKLRHSRLDLMPYGETPYLHVYSFPQIPAYGQGIPIRIADKAEPGLTWLGNIHFALGPEWVFGAGNQVETRHPGYDKYIVLAFQALSNYGRNAQPTIRFYPEVFGLGQKDDLKFRFELKIDGQSTAETEWLPVPDADLHTIGPRVGNGLITVYVRNDNAGGTIYSTDVLFQSTKPALLPRN
jgi:hypothetical protein